MKDYDFVVGITLFNPQGGAILGEQDYMVVYIYDVELVDSTNSYAVLNGNFSTDLSIPVQIGVDSIISITSYLSKTEQKLDGTDVFFLKVIDRSWDTEKNEKIVCIFYCFNL
jgi:hypothetical protein